ncbi:MULTISPECIES: LysR substrate-binding domain-containing protein [unclassified Pseudomonas]|jgi:LysR family transcriptional activator of dmlA|uniref:LysR substrate-binding domain-containing protein n=1 Tax=unclassified Pseudomonas TaxID=196821 RepID=UPI00211F26AA|nr:MULTISPECIES: LysR substrate-binding domain-containing protein [unclassified Pseudomonas]MDD2030583.1 LysR substrate-binding domain-containing protein [Pseudomonas sp. 39167]MEA1027500.1 LysR substrate-binding domain-containing protein [Pseudomonas sp. N-137]
MTPENTFRVQTPLPEDLRVFLTVIRKSSFAGAADELGLSPAFVSKRIRVLEQTLRTRLLHRTTRRIALTEAGEKTQRWAIRFLDDMDDFVGELTEIRQAPRGLLHICSSFGFGRNHVAPAIAELSSIYPELEVRLDVFDRVVDIVAEGFDLEIRVGDDLPGHHISRKLLSNHRVLCATPDYLERRGVPITLKDLAHHDCLVLKERNNPFGVWHLNQAHRDEVVRVSSRLSSNSGEIVLQWALAGRGVLLRSLWDVQPLLDQGKLVRVLPDYTQSANVWAVYPTRLADSAKLRVCVEFLESYLKRLRLPETARA